MNPLHIIYAVSVLMDFAVCGVNFAITRRAAELGASAFQVSMLSGGFFATYILGALILGHLAERWNSRRSAVAGAVVTLLGSIVCALTTNLPVLVATVAAMGFSWGAFWPPLMAWLSEGANGGALSRRLARFSIAWNLGALLGFGVTGKLFKLHPHLAFAITIAAAVLIVGLLLLPMQPMPRETLPANHEPVPHGRGFRINGWLANFGVTVLIGATTALMPKLATQLNIPADQHGGLLALSRGMALVGFWTLQHLHYWRRRLWPLWLTQTAAALAALLFVTGTRVWEFAIASAVIGAASGYSYLASIYFTLEETAAKTRGSGFHEAILGSAFFLGPLVAGIVADVISLPAAFLTVAVLVPALVGIQIALTIRRRRATR
ncbi:MAG: MFS transporter [Verrucomicrobiae bacterium]|nr:MFS transporter [Verrucomicrobiae bacterium]